VFPVTAPPKIAEAFSSLHLPSPPLRDLLIRPRKLRERDREGEGLGGLEVANQLELGGLLDGEIGVRPPGEQALLRYLIETSSRTLRPGAGATWRFLSRLATEDSLPLTARRSHPRLARCFKAASATRAAWLHCSLGSTRSTIRPPSVTSAAESSDDLSRPPASRQDSYRLPRLASGTSLRALRSLDWEETCHYLTARCPCPLLG